VYEIENAPLPANPPTPRDSQVGRRVDPTALVYRPTGSTIQRPTNLWLLASAVVR